MADLAGQALNPQDVTQLMSGLKANSIPNPQTPAVRKDVDMTALLDYQRIRRSLEISLEGGHIGDSDPLIGHVLHTLAGTVKQLIAGGDGASALQFLQGAVASAPPAMAGTPGPPPVQPGPAVGAPPMGQPSPGATPSPLG